MRCHQAIFICSFQISLMMRIHLWEMKKYSLTNLYPTGNILARWIWSRPLIICGETGKYLNGLMPLSKLVTIITRTFSFYAAGDSRLLTRCFITRIKVIHHSTLLVLIYLQIGRACLKAVSLIYIGMDIIHWTAHNRLFNRNKECIR